MADEVPVHRAEAEAHEAGEAIHLPGPSYQPVALALGLTLAITGVVIYIPMTVIGLLITLVTLYLWIRDTRREISELPLEH